MPLEEYEAKRHRGETPEPFGGEPTPAGGQLRFVVQQHHATAMHYDFRLELDGVLMSWAIPKGPSYDPKDKRLAVHVEDHPLDYADFEGVIPKGEYGGGNVIVWDRGTWEPITDPHAGLAKGDFKFRLSGHKLIGGWVLVRLKPRPGEKRENWLLIKERDDHVRLSSEFNVTVDQPLSVISGVRVDDIGSVTGAPRESSDDKESERPGDPQPPGRPDDRGPQPVAAPLVAPPELALCTLVTQPPAGDDWIAEVKYDGYRLTASLLDGRATCYSRSGEDMTQRLAHLAAVIEALPATSALLDGEIVVFNEDGASEFGLLQAALSTKPGQVVLVAFDLLHLNGYDLTSLPTVARKELLQTLLADMPANGPLRFAHHVVGDAPEFMEVACAQGLEGVVAKRADSPYPSGRTRAWLKIKCRRSQEFVVVGFTLPRSGRTGFSALLLGYHDEAGLLRYAGRVGSGFTSQQLEADRARLDQIVTGEPSVIDPPSLDAEIRWVDPQLVAQVAFAEWTADGLLRQPSFKGWRNDIDPATVRRELPDPEPRSVAPEMPATSTVTTSVSGVRISNPGKRLFPESQITKTELARYYEAVAPVMLRECGDRPLTLVRCPVGDGKGRCFYQRHPDRGLPSDVHTLRHILTGHPEADELLFIEDAAGLVSLAQMGVAEIHTWPSRIDAPSRPDRLVFDLDPGPGLEWGDIVAAATVVRGYCEQLGLATFLKSTGGKGLHVVVPIEPVWEFGRAHALAKGVAEAVSSAHPEDFTAKMSKSVRDGRVFIDYVRNSEGASAVAPYSTRFSEGPTVSVPLEWSELDATRDVRGWFTPERVMERLSAGLDPWARMDDASAGASRLRQAERELGMLGLDLG